MEAPDFEGRIEREQRSDFSGGAAGDDCDAGAALALEVRKQLADACKGAGLEAVNAKGGQGAVVVEEQKRGGGGREGRKELFQFGGGLGDHELVHL